MPKLTNRTGLIKKDLSDIIVDPSENARKDYTNIDELAAAIERRGELIQPIVIDKDNNLIAGFRRFKAHQLLVDQGKPFNQIECIIRTGDREILNLEENIHRENLSAPELEAALQKMIDSGMTQKEVAQRLNKRETWVSDSLAAGKTREKAEAAGADTEGLSSSALSVLRNVPEKNLPEAVKETKKNGGTVKAAKAQREKLLVPEEKPWPMNIGDAVYDAEGRQVGEIIGRKKIKWMI